MRIRGASEVGRFGVLCVLMLGGLSQTACELPPGVAVYQTANVGEEKEEPPRKPAVEGCQPTLDLRLASSVAELRSKVPVTIRIRGGDDGSAPGARPFQLVLLNQGQPVKTLLDSPQGLESSDSAVTVPFLPDEIEGLQPGRYVLRASMGCPAAANPSTPASMEVDLFVVRVGATRVEVQAGDGERVPLAYHAVGGTSRNFYPIKATDPASALAVPSGEPELDSPDGTARAFPMPWSGLDSPPLDSTGAVLRTGVAFPVSVTIGTQPDLVFTVGRSGAGADGKPIPTGLDTPSLPPIRLALEGGEASDGNLTEGGKVTVRPSSTPVPSVSRYDVLLQWRFEARDGEGLWQPIPGATQSATVRFYGVLGNEMGASPPNLPWVAVVDAVTRRIGGATSDPAEVRALLVQHIYEESGLRYDRSRGASAYTGYQTPATYSGGVFDLTGFVARAEGSVINCADAASIVSTFANMVGVRLRYAIMLEDFPLNPVLGIGSTRPGSPFDSGNMGFKFHAVASHDSAATINDATLAVDGDANPDAAPFTKRLVQNIPGPEYAQRLSPGNPEYRYVDQVTKVQ
ncbi:MAG: hypothetical protein WBV82_10055 [Myxococcaceae bacterium]